LFYFFEPSNGGKAPGYNTFVAWGKNIEEIVDDIFEGFEIKITEKIPVQFKCDCSNERIDGVLVSLGEEELKKIIEEDKKAEITCTFCNKKYKYNKEQLENLMETIKKN